MFSAQLFCLRLADKDLREGLAGISLTGIDVLVRTPSVRTGLAHSHVGLSDPFACGRAH